MLIYMILKFLILILNLTFIDSFFFSNVNFKRLRGGIKMNNDDYHQKYINYLIEYKNLEINENLNNGLLNFENIDTINENNFKIFKDNYKFIKKMNNKLISNKNSFKLGMNEFFDEIPFYETNKNVMDNTIYKDFTKDLKIDFINKYKNKNPINLFKSLINFKDKINWNETIYSTPVKNQMSCGSCWAFSATSGLEYFMKINNYSIDRLSEQELVDCSKENFGCNGGWMHRAFDFIIKNNGLYSNNDYEYNAKTNKCRYKINPDNDNENIENNTINLKSCNYQSSEHKNCCDDKECSCDDKECSCDDKECKDDEKKLPDNACKVPGSNLKDYEFTIPQSVMDICISLKNGPICIALDASSFYFQFYKEGVIDIPPDQSSQLNHAVLLVGIDQDENGLYYIIQNSWGSKWGDNGFARIRAMDGDGVLLTNLYGVYPTKI